MFCYASPMTYSIVARDPHTREMGVATQSQAFAVGSSVSWARPGAGVIATQSIGEPMYGPLCGGQQQRYLGKNIYKIPSLKKATG